MPIITWLLTRPKVLLAGAIAILLPTLVALAFTASALLVTRGELKSTQTQLLTATQLVGRDEGTLAQLSADSKSRAVVADAAVKAAKATADAANASAQALLGASPSNPQDLCQSARDLVDGVIRKEHP